MNCNIHIGRSENIRTGSIPNKGFPRFPWDHNDPIWSLLIRPDKSRRLKARWHTHSREGTLYNRSGKVDVSTTSATETMGRKLINTTITMLARVRVTQQKPKTEANCHLNSGVIHTKAHRKREGMKPQPRLLSRHSLKTSFTLAHSKSMAAETWGKSQALCKQATSPDGGETSGRATDQQSRAIPCRTTGAGKPMRIEETS